MAVACERREAELIRAAISLAAVLLAGVPACAGAPPPVCRNPDVLDWVTLRLSERNLYTHLYPSTVSEAPGAPGDVVRCNVRTQVFVYDANRNGMRPFPRWEVHGYAVRTGPNGFVVLSVD